MSSLELFDFVLGLVWLAIVPLVLAAYGGHLGAKALTDPNARRFAIFVFWGLCVLGIAIAIVYQYRTRKIDEAREFKSERTEAERQRKLDEAQRHAMETQAELKAIEKVNGDQIVALQKRLDQVIAHAQSADQKSSAQEIKNDLALMAESLKSQAVLVLMLVTSILGPSLTERFAPALLQESPQAGSPLLAGRT